MATTDKRYVEGIGRRKTATARVRLTKANETTITINDRPLADYFKFVALQQNLESVLKTADAGIEHYTVTVKVLGGGLSAQSDAIKLGIARALVGEKADRRTALKKEGYLKRDPRSVERKKFGLRKARKRPAWSKR
jgi:small subunit ribosomal protein S9